MHTEYSSGGKIWWIRQIFNSSFSASDRFPWISNACNGYQLLHNKCIKKKTEKRPGKRILAKKRANDPILEFHIWPILDYSVVSLKNMQPYPSLQKSWTRTCCNSCTHKFCCPNFIKSNIICKPSNELSGLLTINLNEGRLACQTALVYKITQFQNIYIYII